MIALNRRGFLRLGSGGIGVAAAGALAQTTSVSDYRPGVPVEYDFLIQPGAMARFNKSTGAAFQTAPWALSADSQNTLASLTTPQSFDLDQVEAWAQAKNGNCCVSGSPAAPAISDPLDAQMAARFAGGLDLSDIEAALVESVADRTAVDASLEFLYSPGLDRAPAYSVTGRAGLPVIERAPSIQAPPSVELFGWRLQFRGPETHPLGSCVSAPVNHFHVELFQATGGGRYRYASNFHLGTYRSGGTRCFVLFNNVRPVVCWKTCAPTRGDLVGMFKWMLVAAAAVLAVVIVAWIVATIAEAAATVAFAPLLLLA